ncbi:hypothetical protein L3X38_037833 [Prunus dulcis]|uniref:Uncharacterized protein n=1 Tax=Prunus dulcis TaxID=3755 RepID=A0AAD4V429_PRUDU|nr:hypothetical protein L3X38_037833 [Prunus dulcis]
MSCRIATTVSFQLSSQQKNFDPPLPNGKGCVELRGYLSLCCYRPKLNSPLLSTKSRSKAMRRHSPSKNSLATIADPRPNFKGPSPRFRHQAHKDLEPLPIGKDLAEAEIVPAPPPKLDHVEPKPQEISKATLAEWQGPCEIE